MEPNCRLEFMLAWVLGVQGFGPRGLRVLGLWALKLWDLGGFGVVCFEV